MNFLKNILINKKTGIFLIFVVLHIAFFNINKVEWGDSYKILTAAETLREGYYPDDEKRPPLLSFLISLRPEFLDPIWFSKVLLIIFSTLCLILFVKLVDRYLSDKVVKNVILMLFVFNPVFFYWSLRIYADVPFVFFVLLVAYLYSRWSTGFNIIKVSVLGLLTGLSVLLRFEGYLIFLSLGISLMLNGVVSGLGGKSIAVQFIKNLKLINIFVLSFLIPIGPYLYFKNPLKSSYFAEPAGRVYDLKMVLIYLVSLIFITGVIFAFNFIILGRKKLFSFYQLNRFVIFYTVLELALILAWPAAIPRLFVTIIPFVLIFIGFGLERLEGLSPKQNNYLVWSGFLMILVYGIFQILLKQQFLIVNRSMFVVIVLINLSAVLFLYRKMFKLFYTAVIVSAALWTITTVWIHKDIYRSIEEAAVYVESNYSGIAGHNDVNAVAEWYINYGDNPNLQAVYVNYNDSANLSENEIVKSTVSYIIITNEGGRDFDTENINQEYLELIKEFRYNVNGREFFSNIYKFIREK